MESYEEFTQRTMTQIKSAEEMSEPAISLHPSNIRFYGVPILSPLLNKDQKEEMQRLRESATHLMNKWKFQSSSRVSYIQNILDSVQLRKAPTFEEFKDETETTDECNETTESHWTLPVFPAAPQIADETVQVSLGHPMTSTACDGHAVLSLKPLEGKNSLENSHTTVLFEGVPVVGHKQEQSLDLGTDYALDTLSLSQSYHKNPQIDVSHQGLSSGYVTIEPSDVSSGWIVGMEERHSVQSGFFLKSSNSTSIISHAPVDGEVLEEEHTLSNRAQPEEVTEPVNCPVDLVPAEVGPYRMSLQNLLKKSQEHRRHQRMLRNQAKALKVGEALVIDECNLSDKENEEFFPGGTGKTELRRIREKKREQGKEQLPEMKMPSLEIQTQNQGTGRESVKPPDLISYVGEIDPPKCEMPLDHCLNSISSSNTAGSVTEKTMPTLSSCPNMADSPNQSTSATASPSAKSLYQSKSKKAGSLLPRPCQAAGKKFNNVPTPKFCLSPVRSKKGSGISGSFRKPLVKTPVCVDAEAGPNPCVQAKWASSLPAEPGGGVPACRSTDQAEQIAQLELNLSSLKVLISDLESTLSKSMADFNPAEVVEDHNSSQQTPFAEHESISLPASEWKPSCVVTFSEAVQQDVFAKDNGTRPGSKQELPHCVTSMVQRRRVPEVFQAICTSKRLSQRTAVLTDASNQPEEKKNASGKIKKELESIEDSLNGSSLNRSYDVDTPSRLWSQSGPKGKQLTPELGSNEGVSRAKRRLLMNNMDGIEIVQMVDNGQPQSSTPKAASPWPEQLRQEQEVQVRALMEEQCRQQQELLQSLATRYQFLRSVSFPCPSVGSRLEDMATSLPPSSVSMGLGSSSQPSELTLAELSVLSNSLHISLTQNCFPVCHRPLVAAAVKGYLTRRLLHTERVAQLIRTIKDTQLFLQDFQCRTPGREFSSRQDRVLQERVTLQLRSARYELHDLFFSLCPADRMKVISWDRQLAREREFRHKENNESQARRKTTLSAATRKALERKRTVMLQKKAAERSKVVLGTEDSWTFVPNPRRVPKKDTPLHCPR